MNKKIFFKRKAYDKLLEWKKELAPHYAMFIKGARRVGKTSLAEEFGKNEYKSFLKISFDEAPTIVKNLFYENLTDLDYFFNMLEQVYSVKLYKRESLIILDEVQLFPKARQSLKTFLEDERYDYIETGSLAGIMKKTEEENLLIPSEEIEMEVFPFDFEEFLWTLGDDSTIPFLRESFIKTRPLKGMERVIMKKFREYMAIGGMPSVVSEFVYTKDYEKVDLAKRNILRLYKSDIKNQKDEKVEYISNVLDNIPSELSQMGNKTFTLTHINPNARLREYRPSIRWLIDAMIINPSYKALDPSSALTLNISSNSFKCYLMDTGLLLNLAFNDGSYLDNEFYRAILLDNLHINEGMFIENITSQCLRTNGHKIIFYSESDENRKLTMEIDFLIRRDKKVIPIEVKSGKNFSIKSLEKFKKKFSPKIGDMYILYDGDIKREGDITYLPYFMASIL